jgi:hypothetical protein
MYDYVDTSSAMEDVLKYDITTLPTIIKEVNGEVVMRFDGASKMSKFKELLDA